MNRERRILLAIVFAGFAARAVAIWITRPEFVGWFNHSYYYWVQVRGLLLDGRLPYGDLPFLFSLYAVVAGALRWLGVEAGPAIVHTSRALMSLIPALVAVPVYGLVKTIHPDDPLPFRHWVPVVLSAFLPLTLVHAPELLQKNCLGLLLLAGLLLATSRFLHTRSTGALIGGGVLFLLIALTHLGTLAAALLFCACLALAATLESGNLRRAAGGLALVAATVGVGLLSVYWLDPGAFERIGSYARSSLPYSLLGILFRSDVPVRRPIALLGIGVPLGVLLYLLWVYRGRRATLRPPDRIFWLCCLLFGYSLVLPLLDLDLLPRFVLFVPLPGLVIFSYHLEHRTTRGLRIAALVLATGGVSAMGFGEVMDLIFRAPDKHAIHRELVALGQRHRLTEEDFILTRYGVNPICNWFLGTRSGLITAFHEEDIDAYERVFVLNPRDGAIGGPGRQRLRGKTTRQPPRAGHRPHLATQHPAAAGAGATRAERPLRFLRAGRGPRLLAVRRRRLLEGDAGRALAGPIVRSTDPSPARKIALVSTRVDPRGLGRVGRHTHPGRRRSVRIRSGRDRRGQSGDDQDRGENDHRKHDAHGSGRQDMALLVPFDHSGDPAKQRSAGGGHDEPSVRCAQLFQRRQGARVARGTGARGDDEVIAAILPFDPHASGQPPHGRVVEHQRFHDHLEQVDEVVVAGHVSKLVGYDQTELVRREPGRRGDG